MAGEVDAPEFGDRTQRGRREGEGPVGAVVRHAGPSVSSPPRVWGAAAGGPRASARAVCPLLPAGAWDRRHFLTPVHDRPVMTATTLVSLTQGSLRRPGAGPRGSPGWSLPRR